MENTYDLIKYYKKNWQENIDTYASLFQLYEQLNSKVYKNILLDFKGVDFISANLLSVFGALLEDVHQKIELKIFFTNLHPKIKDVMQKNGFGKYFQFEQKADTYHSTIEYKKFSTTTEGLQEFEKYISINVFQRGFLPNMDETIKDAMIDNILEMFNNVIDHAESTTVFVCGQFFPRKKKMTLTITDLGKTIQKNVSEYAARNNTDISNALEWALIQGNSTKETFAPGGLGFSLLLNFLKRNKGTFTLISADQCFQLDHKGKHRYKSLDYSFPGTIVTITINLDDKYYYCINEDLESNDGKIVF